MIFTVTTVMVLVIGLLSLGLALYGGYVSLSVAEDVGGTQEEKHSAEQGFYLLGMIAMVVLIARILVVPLFFWMLQSLVPYLPRAMCVAGVVNAGLPYSLTGVFLKMFLPFVYGFWILVEIANRRHAIPPYTRSLARGFLVVLVPLLLLDSSVDVLFVSSIRPIDAPCCGSVYRIDPPFSPTAMLGPDFGMMIVILSVVSVVILVGVLWLQPSRGKIVVTIVLIAIASLLYLVSLHDTLAPLVLGLPEHHCPFCTFQEFPDTVLFAGLFWIGIASAGWRSGFNLIWNEEQQSQSNLRGLDDKLLTVSTVALLLSMIGLIIRIFLAV